MKRVGVLRLPNALYYGKGSIKYLPEEAIKFGKKALFLSDEAMKGLGYVDQVTQLLSQSGIESILYLGVDSETKDTHVAEALAILEKNQCEMIIALGGGSCIDAAKAVGIKAKNRTSFMDYVSGKKIEKASVPVIAIPTTAGTGSEVTDAFVVTNTEENIKMMVKQAKITPRVAIVDPSFTMSVPASLTVATGIDALSHGIEAFISKRSHRFTDELALNSIKTIMANIRTVYHDGNHEKARERMAYASMQAGIAFSNSSVALVHGMSRPIGALFNVPHGISNAMLLAPVLEFSFKDCVKDLATIGRTVEPKLEQETDEVAAKYFIGSIQTLCQDLAIPNLKEWGIDETLFFQSLDKMASDALASGSPHHNPRTPTKSEIIDLYKMCYTYSYTS